MERAHPSQPKNVNFSLRNIEERMAHITTDRAPRGVYLECEGEKTRLNVDKTHNDDGFDKGICYGDELRVRVEFAGLLLGRYLQNYKSPPRSLLWTGHQ